MLEKESGVMGQRGGSKINALLGLIILGALVFSAIKIVPLYVNNYQLQDAMEEEARFAAYNRKTSDEIRTDIEKKVEELGVPVVAKQIQVTDDQPGRVTISIDYTVSVDLKVYQLQLHFHPQADNTSI